MLNVHLVSARQPPSHLNRKLRPPRSDDVVKVWWPQCYLCKLWVTTLSASSSSNVDFTLRWTHIPSFLSSQHLLSSRQQEVDKWSLRCIRVTAPAAWTDPSTAAHARLSNCTWTHHCVCVCVCVCAPHLCILTWFFFYFNYLYHIFVWKLKMFVLIWRMLTC